MISVQKNGFSKYVILIVFILLMASCSSDSGESNSENEKNGTDDQEIFKLQLSSIYPSYEGATDSPIVFLGPEFIKEVEERSDGRIIIDDFYSGELIPQSEMLNALKSNTIDFGIAAPQFYGDTAPTTNLSSLPYWADSLEDGRYIMQETIAGELINSELEEQGVKIIANIFNADYGFATTKPVKNYEDISNLLFRSAGWAQDVWFEEMGISTAAVPVTDVYDSLQRGVVDGTAQGFSGLEQTSYGEVLDYIIEPAFIKALPVSLFMNRETLDKLPEDLQTIIAEVALEMEEQALTMSKEVEGTKDEQLEKYKIETITFPEEEQQKFYDSAQIVWDKFAEQSENNAKIIDFLREEHEIK